MGTFYSDWYSIEKVDFPQINNKIPALFLIFSNNLKFFPISWLADTLPFVCLHMFMKSGQNLIYSLTFRHPMRMIPWMSNKSSWHSILTCLSMGFFPPLGELGVFQCMDWHLISGLYVKTHDSSHVIPCQKANLDKQFKMFFRILVRSFWLAVRFSTPTLNTLFALFKLSYKNSFFVNVCWFTNSSYNETMILSNNLTNCFNVFITFKVMALNRCTFLLKWVQQAN